MDSMPGIAAEIEALDQAAIERDRQDAEAKGEEVPASVAIEIDVPDGANVQALEFDVAAIRAELGEQKDGDAAPDLVPVSLAELKDRNRLERDGITVPIEAIRDATMHICSQHFAHEVYAQLDYNWRKAHQAEGYLDFKRRPNIPPHIARARLLSAMFGTSVKSMSVPDGNGGTMPWNEATYQEVVALHEVREQILGDTARIAELIEKRRKDDAGN